MTTLTMTGDPGATLRTFAAGVVAFVAGIVALVRLCQGRDKRAATTALHLLGHEHQLNYRQSWRNDERGDIINDATAKSRFCSPTSALCEPYATSSIAKFCRPTHSSLASSPSFAAAGLPRRYNLGEGTNMHGARLKTPTLTREASRSLTAAVRFAMRTRRMADATAAAEAVDAPQDLVHEVSAAVPAGSTVVIKYGGHAMNNPAQFAKDVAALQGCGVRCVVVHGGGPAIAAMLGRLEIESRFEQGLRVTDPATMEVAQMVLCGLIGKDVCRTLAVDAGVRAVGLCGLDAGLLRARKLRKKVVDEATGAEVEIDLGLVGEVETVDASLLNQLLDAGLVPVVSPVASDTDGGGSLNVNADTAAGAVAEALGADSLLLLTDVAGVLDASKTLIPRLTPDRIAALTAEGTIFGGMIPKLETATDAVTGGVGSAIIVDGRVQHALLKTLAGTGAGTAVVPNDT